MCNPVTGIAHHTNAVFIVGERNISIPQIDAYNILSKQNALYIAFLCFALINVVFLSGTDTDVQHWWEQTLNKKAQHKLNLPGGAIMI